MDTESSAIRMEIPSAVELVNVVRMTVMNAVESQGALTGSRLDDLRLATSEAVTNAIQANLERDGSQPVKIRCIIADGLVRLEITDFGFGMPPDENLPPLSDPARLHTEGGFGVPLMKALSNDRVEFDTSARGTTVRIWLAQ
ncbi:MAG: ATP-binding protein [Acidimicrobiales bacterium]|nr:ATP-binding protein [Acidimicrobiales bacterium]